MPGTVRLHRVLSTKPEKLYRAFTDADALVKWLPPNGFVARMHHADIRVGGSCKMSFANFTTGHAHSFETAYQEMTPHKKLRYTSRFDDPNLPGEMTATVTLEEVSVGTSLTIVQEGIPDVIPVEGCYLGWQESLCNLAKLVEPDIKG